MVSSTSVQIRLTKQQKERLILAVQNAGHKTISEFIRSQVLGYDLNSQKLILQIHQKICGGGNEIKK